MITNFLTTGLISVQQAMNEKYYLGLREIRVRELFHAYREFRESGDVNLVLWTKTLHE